MTPLRLTDEQLNQVMATAAPIPPDLRGEFLQRVADQLRGSEFGDGEVYRACRAAAKAVSWSMQRAINEMVAPRGREPNRLLTRANETRSADRSGGGGACRSAAGGPPAPASVRAAARGSRSTVASVAGAVKTGWGIGLKEASEQ
jgi:hypothetical protein